MVGFDYCCEFLCDFCVFFILFFFVRKFLLVILFFFYRRIFGMYVIGGRGSNFFFVYKLLDIKSYIWICGRGLYNI